MQLLLIWWEMNLIYLADEVVSGGILFERNTAIKILIIDVQAVLFRVAVLELKEVEHVILKCELIVIILAFLVITFL